MSEWNSRLALAIAQLGQDGFASRLEHALAALLRFRICMVFAYEGARRPRSLHHNMAPEVAAIVVSDYMAGPYLLDPLHAEVVRGRREGMAGLRQLAPDSFFKSQYYQSHYHRTGIKDELGVFAALSESEVAVLSVARGRDAPVFSASERALLADVAPVLSALMVSHWGAGSSPAPRAEPGEATLPAILQRIGEALTPRETEIVGMILKGYSAAAVGARLGISEATVKVHKRNAYRKLGISSQAQLFSRFVAAL